MSLLSVQHNPLVSVSHSNILEIGYDSAVNNTYFSCGIKSRNRPLHVVVVVYALVTHYCLLMYSWLHCMSCGLFFDVTNYHRKVFNVKNFLIYNITNISLHTALYTGKYENMDPSKLPKLWLAYLSDPSDSGERM